MSRSQVLSALSSNLSSSFVSTEKFTHEFALSILSGISPIWWGRGGFGKTEMIRLAMQTFQVPQTMLEAHPELAVSGLFGGAIAETKVEHISQDGMILGSEKTYESVNYDRGLLKSYLFFIEEMLDSPMQVLTSLKSVMTNKVWDQMQSQHRLILGATNINPYELMEEVPFTHRNSYDALLQRFLVIEHGWESHDFDNYLELFQFKPAQDHVFTHVSKQQIEHEAQLAANVKVSSESYELLAELAAKSAEEGSVVSPRVAMWSLKLLKTNAFLQGRTEVDVIDFNALHYMGSWSKEAFSGITKILAEQKIRQQLNQELSVFVGKIQKIDAFWRQSEGNPHFKALNCIKACQKLMDEVDEWTINDTFAESKSELISEIQEKLDIFQSKSEQSVVYKEII
jgi:MoxR-like ATPase